MPEENLSLFYDTFYADQDNNGKIYSKLINSIETEELKFTPVLSSLIERCRNSEDRLSVQSEWNQWLSGQLEEVAGINPFLPYHEVGEEISSIEAIAWVDGTRNVDTNTIVIKYCLLLVYLLLLQV